MTDLRAVVSRIHKVYFPTDDPTLWSAEDSAIESILREVISETLKEHLHLDNHNAIVQMKENQIKEARSEVLEQAAKTVEECFMLSTTNTARAIRALKDSK